MAAQSNDADVIQMSIGIMGRWQFWVCAAIFLVKFPVAWHQLSIVFLAPPVNFTCNVNTTDRCSAACEEHIFDHTLFERTIVTQWDLVCDKGWLANMAQMVTMLGILFGSFIFGILADKFGRRGPLVWGVVLQVISGVATAVSPYFWLFLIMRFLSALATGGTMVASFVLVMEIVGTKWRTTVGVLYQIPFNLGHLSLAGMGYLLRDWRYFQLAISLPSLLLVSYYWIMPESPRWLMAVGKNEEAIKVLEKAAHHNDLPTDTIKADVAKYSQISHEKKHTGSALDLFRTRHIRNITLFICFNWIVCGLCFFGVAQYMGQTGGNIFINVAVSAAIQLPGTFLSMYLMKSWGRRYTLIASNTLAGLSCLSIAFVPSDPTWPKTMLGTLGMLGLSISFPTVYIFSGELFPTVVRNIGVGTSSMCARFGSMVAPFIAGLAELEPWLPPMIFGITPLVGAFLCYYLPETLDCKLPDTLEDVENFKRKSEAKGNGVTANGNGKAIEMESQNGTITK